MHTMPCRHKLYGLNKRKTMCRHWPCNKTCCLDRMPVSDLCAFVLSSGREEGSTKEIRRRGWRQSGRMTEGNHNYEEELVMGGPRLLGVPLYYARYACAALLLLELCCTPVMLSSIERWRDGDVTWPADTLTDVGPNVGASTATLGILFHVHSFINQHSYNWLNKTKYLH